MHGVQKEMTQSLAHWTLADLKRKPRPAPELCGKVNCRMGPACKHLLQTVAGG